MTFVTLIDVNKRIGDACGRAIAAMEKADLTRGPELTNAASRAYRIFFNGLIFEQDYGPDKPVEWAARSARIVILIRELAGEYRMLSETSEEYDTQQCLRQVAIALNTVANEIEDLRPEAGPETEPEPGEEDVPATNSSLIDWDDDIKEALLNAVKHIGETRDIVAKMRDERHTQAFVQLLYDACARKDFVNATFVGKRLQLIRAKVIIEGVAEQYAQLWAEAIDPVMEEKMLDAKMAVDRLDHLIVKALRDDYTKQ
nr:MAG TPA: hypothetical protein [Caudoviricetes sp.]